MKNIQNSFRLRSYFCAACNLHLEVFGNDPDPTLKLSCRCTAEKKAIPSFVLEWDQWIINTRSVQPYPPPA